MVPAKRRESSTHPGRSSRALRRMAEREKTARSHPAGLVGGSRLPFSATLHQHDIQALRLNYNELKVRAKGRHRSCWHESPPSSSLLPSERRLYDRDGEALGERMRITGSCNVVELAGSILGDDPGHAPDADPGGRRTGRLQEGDRRPCRDMQESPTWIPSAAVSSSSAAGAARPSR